MWAILLVTNVAWTVKWTNQNLYFGHELDDQIFDITNVKINSQINTRNTDPN